MAMGHTLFLTTTTALLLVLLFTANPVVVSADTTAMAPAAAGPLNLTAILEKSGQYSTFLRLMKETQVDTQLSSQLNNSYDGLTMFVPTDNAFSSLKPGTLNGLTSQEQVELILYHILPRYYSLTTFQTASNPLRTQASGSDGVYTMNVTSTTNSANVSTGVNSVAINNALYSEFPLAIYSVDQVLLPDALFGAPAPAAAPEPAAEMGPKKKKPAKGSSSGDVAAAPAMGEAADKAAAGSLKGSVSWGVLAVLGAMGVVNVFGM